ncbi:hypothetical protein BC628DRAFT_1422829 [Trametes gibbosa]|nr:hypothetical protein BC628DRAFT_1422829 [Trametes gibbosa]
MYNELVIVVTGANGGVGFGICHRLLVQLSSLHPSDAQPHFNFRRDKALGMKAAQRSPDAGVTIIMACRDPKRAQDARDKLYGLLDEHIAKIEPGTEERLYAVAFRKSVRLDVEKLDLSSVKSVLDFGKAVCQKYEYISHLILNAGTATYSHFDILGFLYDVLQHPIHTVEHPRRNIQVNGVLSNDNLGYTWQCNVFGHYVLYRSVQPLLLACVRKTNAPARVLWMSSLDAEPTFDPKEDWQLTRTKNSYNASKYQIDLICAELGRRTLQAMCDGPTSSSPDVVAPCGEFHHYIVSPGITPSNMSALLNIPIPGWRYLMLAVFYIVRFLGSPHVLATLYGAAIAAVHIALVPLRAIPTVNDAVHAPLEETSWPKWHSYCDKFTSGPPRLLALRFGAETDWWGRERIGAVAIPVWEEHPDLGETLLEKYERLYQLFLHAEGGISGLGDVKGRTI